MHFPTSLVRRGLPLLAGGVLALALAGCNEVKQSDYDALKAQLNAKEQALAAAQQKVTDLQKQLSAAAAPASGTDEVVPIFGSARRHPRNLFRFGHPADTSPAGCLASMTAGGAVQHVRGACGRHHGKKYGLPASLGCVQQNVFKRGMKMVFRIEFYDMATGKRVTPQDRPLSR
jgi:hypothetical protein